MPFPDHWLFVMGGHYIGAGEAPEIWQNTVRGAPAGGFSGGIDDEEDALDQIQDAVAAWFHNAGSVMRSDAQLDYIKLNRINPDGTYHDPVTHERFYTGTPVVGASTPLCNPILTMAIGWRTARTRGIGSHGRIFPPIWIAAGPGYKVSDADAMSYAVAGRGLLEALNNPGGGGTFTMAPAVVSRGANAGAGAGVIADITSVVVGNVIDVQRRRKEQIVETFQETPYPA